MRPLNKLQSLLYALGGLLLCLGALIPVFLNDNDSAPYVFTLGAVMFSSMQIMQGYKGNDLTVRRLRRQQIIGAIALVVAGGLMFCNRYGLWGITGAEWQMVLAIGAVLEVYTAFRIPAALEKAGEA